ncbi:MAG: UMP kinase [Methanoculleaceae archaeon]
MKIVVLSLGGSVLVPSLERHTIREYAEVLRRLSGSCRLIVVCGGGGEARRYINTARELGIDQGTADEIGIMVTRINAMLLSAAIGDAAHPRVAESYTEALDIASSGRIAVLGGISPAQTTDAVAAVIAERARADLIVNATSVDGIYSADPKKDESAVRYERLTPGELVEIIAGSRMDAGANTVIDLVAARVIERSGIPVLVIDGRDPFRLVRALETGGYTGTLISETGLAPIPL